MKICDLKLTTVNVPFAEPEIWSGGRRAGITSIVVEVSTDAGIIGVGEAVPAPSPRVTLAALEDMKALILGEDPFYIERIVNKIYSIGGFYPFSKSANCAIGGLEMALWDVIGKALGKPLHLLFGGALRSEISYMYFVQRKGVTAMTEEARLAAAAGFNTIYTKVGLDYESDVEVVKALREAVCTKPRLRVDANEAWSPGTAARIMREMEPYDLEYVEQPVPMGDIDHLKALRTRTAIPIAANQTSWTNRDLFRALASGAVDVVMTDPHQAGGLLAFKKAAGIAEAAGVPVVFHSFGPLAITTYAAMHVIASSTNFMLDNQTYNHLLTDDVVINIPSFRGGKLQLPETPGIGVELDPEKMEKYAQLYRKEGYYSAYDSAGADYGYERKKKDDVVWFPNQ